TGRYWADSFIATTPPTETLAALASCSARVLASATAFSRAWAYSVLVSLMENHTLPKVTPSPTARVAASITAPARLTSWTTAVTEFDAAYPFTVPGPVEFGYRLTPLVCRSALATPAAVSVSINVWALPLAWSSASVAVGACTWTPRLTEAVSGVPETT